MKPQIYSVAIWLDPGIDIDPIPDDELDQFERDLRVTETDNYSGYLICIALSSPDEIPETLDRVEKAAAKLREKYN